MATETIHQAMVKNRYRTADLPLEFVRDILEYDPETGVLTWVISPKGRRKSRRGGQVAGTVTDNGYISVTVKPGVVCRGHRLAWALFHGEWPSHDIDHVDGNRSNNRLTNLRKANGALNGANKAMQRNNSSGYVGVHFNAQNGKWRACVTRDGTRHDVGFFDGAEQAHLARKRFLEQLKDTHGPADPHRPKYAHYRDKGN